MKKILLLIVVCLSCVGLLIVKNKNVSAYTDEEISSSFDFYLDETYIQENEDNFHQYFNFALENGLYENSLFICYDFTWSIVDCDFSFVLTSINIEYIILYSIDNSFHTSYSYTENYILDDSCYLDDFCDIDIEIYVESLDNFNIYFTIFDGSIISTSLDDFITNIYADIYSNEFFYHSFCEIDSSNFKDLDLSYLYDSIYLNKEYSYICDIYVPLGYTYFNYIINHSVTWFMGLTINSKKEHLLYVYENLPSWLDSYLYNLKDSSYKDGRTDGILIGKNQGIEQGIQQGIQQGIEQGYINCENENHETIRESARLEGQKNGENVNASFKDMILSIVNAPANMIKGILNFEIFGVNIGNLVFFLISAVLVLAIIKFFI